MGVLWWGISGMLVIGGWNIFFFLIFVEKKLLVNRLKWKKDLDEKMISEKFILLSL